MTQRSQRILFRCLMVVILPFAMIYCVAKVAIAEFSSAIKYTFYYEPRISWREWLAAFKKGAP